MRNHAWRAFTLIELLIVVAIIAILALIAVPNFLEAQVRAKVSRSKTDIRTISVAWEAYHVDWNCYPQDQDNWIDTGSGGGDPATEWGYRQITTPVAYITSIPFDPFFSAQGLNPGMGDGYLSYAPNYEVASEQISAPSGPRNSGKYDCYCIHGLGPDRNDDFNGNDLWPDNDSNTWEYDPTNGTVSEGDINRFGGQYRTGANWTYNGVSWRLWAQFGF